MNNLEKYVDYLQPVVKTFKENYNQFYRLEYYNLSAEDLFVDDCLVEFQTQDKNRPEHFSGNIPMVYAQWGEETGASMVDHQYFQTCAGFEPADDYSYISDNNIGDALDFLSCGLHLEYFLIGEGYSDLEYVLDQ
jgi:hypothetical protein